MYTPLANRQQCYQYAPVELNVSLGSVRLFPYYLTDLIPEDSGNYTCEVRGPRSAILGAVTHYLYVRGKSDAITLPMYRDIPEVCESE